jgi:hypothetical protein
MGLRGGRANTRKQASTNSLPFKTDQGKKKQLTINTVQVLHGNSIGGKFKRASGTILSAVKY